MTHTLIALDLETSGLDPATDEILSIAAVSSASDSQPFSIYVQPTKPVPADAALKNGFSPQKWHEKWAVPLNHALIAFQHWLTQQGDHPHRALAHNAAFDRAFLDAAQRQTGIDLRIPHRWRCSMVTALAAIDSEHLPQSPVSLNHLGTLSGYFTAADPRYTAHDALQDAQCCLHIYRWLISLLHKKETPAAP